MLPVVTKQIYEILKAIFSQIKFHRVLTSSFNHEYVFLEKSIFCTELYPCACKIRRNFIYRSFLHRKPNKIFLPSDHYAVHIISHMRTNLHNPPAVKKIKAEFIRENMTCPL